MNPDFDELKRSAFSGYCGQDNCYCWSLTYLGLISRETISEKTQDKKYPDTVSLRMLACLMKSNLLDSDTNSDGRTAYNEISFL